MYLHFVVLRMYLADHNKPCGNTWPIGRCYPALKLEKSVLYPYCLINNQRLLFQYSTFWLSTVFSLCILSLDAQETLKKKHKFLNLYQYSGYQNLFHRSFVSTKLASENFPDLSVGKSFIHKPKSWHFHARFFIVHLSRLTCLL